MDNFDTNDPQGENNSEDLEFMEDELSHSDKIAGVFTEPTATFEKTAKFPPKTVDWLLPVFLIALLTIISQFLYLSNSELYYQIKEKQLTRIEKNFDKMVQEKKMTREAADQQINDIQDRMEKGRTPVAMILQAVGIILFVFIAFFIVSGVYFLFAKFALKGDGNYQSAMAANGLMLYIKIIEIIITTILALALGKIIGDTSLASLTGVDRTSFLGFVYEKINPITIWAFIVLSIGLAKMFKSQTTGKYYVMVFGLWIGWGLIIYALVKAVPFLSFLAG